MSRLDSVARKIAELQGQQKALIAARARQAKQEKQRFRDELAAAVIEEVEAGQTLTLSHIDDLVRLVEVRRQRRQARACNLKVVAEEPEKRFDAESDDGLR